MRRVIATDIFGRTPQLQQWCAHSAQAGVASTLVDPYQGQLRHHLSLQPKCPMFFIFPEREPNFDVQQCMASLQKKPEVVCRQIAYGHGFMNALSNNYSVQAGQYYFGVLAQKEIWCTSQRMRQSLF